jgi:hypothetical protein
MRIPAGVPRQWLVVAAAVATASVVAAAPAWSYWRTADSDSVGVKAATVRKPGRVVAEWTDGGARLVWGATDPASGSIDPDGYLIERRAAGSFSWQLLNGPAPTCDAERRACLVVDAVAIETRSYQYRVTSALQRWRSAPTETELAGTPATSETLAPSTIPAPTDTSAPASSASPSPGPTATSADVPSPTSTTPVAVTSTPTGAGS